MNEQLTSHDKIDFLKYIKSSKMFSKEEMEYIIDKIDSIEGITELLKSKEYGSKMSIIIETHYQKKVEFIIEFILNRISSNPIYHPIAMIYSDKYREFYNKNVDDKKFEKIRFYYYLNRFYFYFILLYFYLMTLGLGFVLRMLYLNKKKKKFIQYLNSADFEYLISFII